MKHGVKKKPSFHHLGVLEYIGNALLDEEEIDKLDKESKECFFFI